MTVKTVMTVPSDTHMVTRLWPLLLVSAVGLIPFTIFSTFLVHIAHDVDSTVAAIGSLRGLGGIAALVVGIAMAPLIDRLPRNTLIAGSLTLLAVSALTGTIASEISLAIFCLLTGAATALLTPAVSAAAADTFPQGPAAGRAATLVSATQSMTAMLAAPLVAIPALWWGWRGDLFAVAAGAILLAFAFLRPSRTPRPATPQTRKGYLASFRDLARIPGAIALIAIGHLRTAAFMGFLAYLAGYYYERFNIDAGWFALVWTISGAGFFVGNYLTGRLVNQIDSHLKPHVVLYVSLGAATAITTGFAYVQWLPLALVLTALLGFAHAGAAACVISLLVERCENQRGTALSLNASGMSLGVFTGAALGASALGYGGYSGLAIAMTAITLLGVLVWSVSHWRMRHQTTRQLIRNVVEQPLLRRDLSTTERAKLLNFGWKVRQRSYLRQVRAACSLTVEPYSMQSSVDGSLRVDVRSVAYINHLVGFEI